MTKYRIAWRSLKTGVTGAGTALFDFDQAMEIAHELNLANRGILYHCPAVAPAGTTSEPHGEPPAPAALAVTDEPGQGSGSGSMAAGRAGSNP